MFQDLAQNPNQGELERSNTKQGVSKDCSTSTAAEKYQTYLDWLHDSRDSWSCSLDDQNNPSWGPVASTTRLGMESGEADILCLQTVAVH
jgi:hypothetical protein